MSGSSRHDWLVCAGLIALALIPVAAGMTRLTMLAEGAPATLENARFVAAPIAVVTHILAVTIYSLVGAFQFHAGLRRRNPVWHRRAGRVLVVAGLAAALSGLWMAEFYAITPADHPLLHALRLLAGTGVVMALVLGFAAIRQRDVGRHQDWMRRAYAIAMGAGTQALVLLPMMLVFGALDPLTYALGMGIGWAVNLAVVEWLIAKRRWARLTAIA